MPAGSPAGIVVLHVESEGHLRGTSDSFKVEHGDVDYTRPRSKDEFLRGSALSDHMRGEASTIMLDFYAQLAREEACRRYRDEREYPEWVDYGGES